MLSRCRKKKHTSEQETQNGFVVASFEEDIEKCSTLALNTSSLAAFAEKITAIEGILELRKEPKVLLPYNTVSRGDWLVMLEAP